MPTLSKFAEAIALRISDEWDGKNEFPEDADLLNEVLANLFKQHPDECKRLIGTGIIEEDYFETLT